MTVFNHTTNLNKSSIIREIVFGMEDGMVSTLGAITGIAVGSQDQFTILLAGSVIIAVESVSMGIGSFISNSVSKEVDQQIVEEEKLEIATNPTEEKRELLAMFIRDGWPENLAKHMTAYAHLSERLMLKEMQYRELGISPLRGTNPFANALSMFGAFIAGGLIPLFSYYILPVNTALRISVVSTLFSLFVLGVATTKFTNRKPFNSGFRIFLLGGIALTVGYVIGEISILFQ